jgi:hypothetical protein
LDLLKLSVDQSMASKISGVFAPPDWGFSINTRVCLGFLISQGTSGAFTIRSLVLLACISGPGAVWSFKFVGDL